MIQECRVLGEQRIVLGALNMKPLCKSCFAFVMGLKRSDVTRKIKAAREDKVRLERAGKGKQGKFSEKGANVRFFLQRLWDEGNVFHATNWSLGNHSPKGEEVILAPFGKSYYYDLHCAYANGCMRSRWSLASIFDSRKSMV